MPVGLVVDTRKDVCKVWSSASRRVVTYDSCELPRDVARGNWLQIRLDDAGHLERIFHCDREVLDVKVMPNAVAALDWFLLDVPAPASVGDGEDSPLFAYSSLLGFVPLTRRFRVPQITKGMAFKLFAEIAANGGWQIFDQITLDSVDERDRNGEEVRTLERQMREDSSAQRRSAREARETSPPPPRDPRNDRSDTRNNEPWERESHSSRGRDHQYEDAKQEEEETVPPLGEWVKILMTGNFNDMFFAGSPYGDVAVLREHHKGDPRIKDSKGKVFHARIGPNDPRHIGNPAKSKWIALEIDLQEADPPDGVTIIARGGPQLMCPVKISKMEGEIVDVFSPLIGDAFVPDSLARLFHERYRVGQWLQARVTRVRDDAKRSIHWMVQGVEGEIGPPTKKTNLKKPIEAPHRVHNDNPSFEVPTLALFQQREVAVLISSVDFKKMIAFAATPFGSDYGEAILLGSCLVENSQIERGQVFRAIVSAEKRRDGRDRLRVLRLVGPPIRLPEDLEISVTMVYIQLTGTVQVVDTNEDMKPTLVLSELVGVVPVRDDVGRGGRCRRGDYLRARIHGNSGGWSVVELRDARRPPLPLLPSPLDESENFEEDDFPPRGYTPDVDSVHGSVSSHHSHLNPNDRYGSEEWITVLITKVTPDGKLFSSSAKYGNVGGKRSSIENPSAIDSLRAGMFVRVKHSAHSRRDGAPAHIMLSIDPRPLSPPDGVTIVGGGNKVPEVVCTMRVESRGSTLFTLVNDDFGPAALMFEDAPSWMRVGDVVRVQLHRIGERGDLPSNWKVSPRKLPIEKVREERRESDRRREGNRGYEDTRDFGRNERGEEGGMGSLVCSLLEMESVREALAREGRLDEVMMMRRMMDEGERMIDDERRGEFRR